MSKFEFDNYLNSYHKLAFGTELSHNEDIIIVQTEPGSVKSVRMTSGILLGLFLSSLFILKSGSEEESKPDQEQFDSFSEDSQGINRINKKYLTFLQWRDLIFRSNYAERYKELIKGIPYTSIWELLEDFDHSSDPNNGYIEKKLKEIRQYLFEKLEENPGFGSSNDFSSDFEAGFSNKENLEKLVKTLENDLGEVLNLHYKSGMMHAGIVSFALLLFLLLLTFHKGHMVNLRTNIGKKKVYIDFHFAIDPVKTSTIDLDNFKVEYLPFLISNGHVNSPGYQLTRRDEKSIIGFYGRIKREEEFYDRDRIKFLQFLTENSSKI